jgi:diaminopimelate epimerase
MKKDMSGAGRAYIRSNRTNKEQRMRFIKMHGIGNDYVYVDCFRERIENPAALAVAVSRPHFGIGADGLVLIGPSAPADFSMRIFNADGSEGEMCGNAARCIGKYVYERGLAHKSELTLETKAGIRALWLSARDGTVYSVRVDMGEPKLRPEEIVVDLPGDRVILAPVEAAGRTWKMTCVSVGNPHAVVFVDHDPAALDLATVGPAFEHHPLFPNSVNTEFVQVLAADSLRMRVWERGSGETQACGTGACAALAAAALCSLTDRRATVHLLGGDLDIEWDPYNDHLFMTGPAAIVFEGEWLGDDAFLT